MITTEYVTWVNSSSTYRGPDLERAIRSWNLHTHIMCPPGGVSVQVWDDDVMVRDGWILHVHDDGIVYLTPYLSDTVSNQLHIL